MQFCHIKAVCRNNGIMDKNDSFTLICGVNENKRIINAKWYGCCELEKELYPFIFYKGILCYQTDGGEPDEQTNILTKDIIEGNYFTINYYNGEQSTYLITKVTYYS